MKYNNAEMFPEIKTERLLIRPFKEDDLEDLYGIYMDEKTCRYLLHDAWNKDNKHQHFQKANADDGIIYVLHFSHWDIVYMLDVGILYSRENVAPDWI